MVKKSAWLQRLAASSQRTIRSAPSALALANTNLTSAKESGLVERGPASRTKLGQVLQCAGRFMQQHKFTAEDIYGGGSLVCHCPQVIITEKAPAGTHGLIGPGVELSSAQQ